MSNDDHFSVQKINIHLQYLVNQASDYGYERMMWALVSTLDRSYYSRTPSQRKMISYPSSYVIYNNKDWDNVNSELLRDTRFGLALMKYWDTDELLNGIIEGKTTKKQKAKAIYEYVRANMSWNGVHDIYVDIDDSDLKKIYGAIAKNPDMKDLGDVLKKGKGSSSEINFILIHLLRKAGIKTYSVLSNTKDSYPVDKNIPQVKQFRTVMAMINSGEGDMILDAAHPESQFDSPADIYGNTEKCIIDQQAFRWLEQ
jgi:hypothetical protein